MAKRVSLHDIILNYDPAAPAALFTPGYPVADWYAYRHNIAEYIPLVTGKDAPFNDSQPEMARYYHTLGLYFPCTIGAKRVLLVKSVLHFAYDDPACPVGKLMHEIATVVRPQIFITTGTGSGIGAQVMLGDVVIAGTVKFDCKTQFKNKSWADASYHPSALRPAALAALMPALTSVNAARIPGARPAPQFFTGADDAIVTTDFFAFDDSTDHYGLQGLGRACDMGDAMVAKSLHGLLGLSWYAIRNASDPQIANPDNNITAAREAAAIIYAKYGGLTTAASVLASWAVIHTFN